MAKRTNRKEEDSAPDRANSLAPITGPTDLNRIIESMFHGFDAAESRFFPSFSSLNEAALAVDLIDHGSHYTFTAELPGFTKDEVDVRVDEHSVQIKAERKEQRESKDKYSVRREQTHSVYHRLISIPEGVSSSKVTGTMNNGVLELKLPKKEPVSEERTRRVPLA